MTYQPVSRYLIRVKNLIASRRFYFGVVIFFIIEAAWIALTGKYPMAFDEDFHLGIIRLYAQHVNPFWDHQPVGADIFGAITRDPSYLYHFVMSFPYRLITALTDNQAVQVLFLRALNIGLFATSLPIFRKLLLKVGASTALVHTCLTLFVLTPMTPLLAAQINYDNVFVPLTGFVLLGVLKVTEAMKRTRQIPLLSGLGLVSLLLLGSLIKYAFLPIALAGLAYVAVVGFRVLDRSAIWSGLRSAGRSSSKLSLGLLLVAIIVLSGLFVERFGLNLAHYHKPVPDCSQVLSIEQCSAYGPWVRDYNLSQSHSAGYGNPISFLREWFYGMWLRSFFAVDGPGTRFQTRGPLDAPGLTAATAGIIGLLLAGRYWRAILARYNRSALTLFAVVSGTYIGVLMLDEYEGFSKTGEPVAINGRYLLPLLLPILLVVGLAYLEALKRYSVALKTGVAVAILVCFLWGGGALTYILRSNDAWYWPSPVVKTANHAVKQVIGPITPGYRRPIAFLH